MKNGYLVVGRFQGSPVRVHWSTLIGLFVLSGFSFAPGAWLGFAILLFVHEAGHAILARKNGLMVLSIDVHALGGACRMAGDPTGREASIVAWGGVLAQATLLVPALVLSWVLPSWSFFGDLTSVLIRTNLILIALNLLPFPPLDGAEAWKLFGSRRAG